MPPNSLQNILDLKRLRVPSGWCLSPSFCNKKQQGVPLHCESIQVSCPGTQRPWPGFKQGPFHLEASALTNRPAHFHQNILNKSLKTGQSIKYMKLRRNCLTSVINFYDV